MNSSTSIDSLVGSNAAEPTLELSRLTKRLVSEDGISSTELASLAIEEYKRFFLLCTLIDSENEVLVPSPMVDMVWQRHQLDTCNYFEDCQRFCFPEGYLHRHHVTVGLPKSLVGEEEKIIEDSVSSVHAAYKFTLDRYEQTFGQSPDARIWPSSIMNTTENHTTQQYGVAIPGVQLALLHMGETKTAESTEDEMVADLLWVGEVVRAELPKKQARCPGQREPINQIRFYPHCDCFVPSAEQEQARLVLVVREYVRFLRLVIKYQLSVEDTGSSAVNSDDIGEILGAQEEQNEEKVADAIKGGEKSTDASKSRRPEPFQVTPSKLVDELWHAHILRSPAYFQFCAQHAPGGQYVHHAPHFDKPHNYHEPGFNATLQAYVAEFGCPPKDVWGVLGESGGGPECAACVAVINRPECTALLRGRDGRLHRAMVITTVTCGACSSTNGNEGKSYTDILSARQYFPTMSELGGHSNYRSSWRPDLFFVHNQLLNRGENYVLGRSNLRVFSRLVIQYGRDGTMRRKLLSLFLKVHGQYPFLCAHLVEEPLLYHIARQIYEYESNMMDAAALIARLSDRDAAYERWWARNGPAVELLESVNPLLARFNVRLVKQVETVKNHMYDHYLLVPTTTPYMPPQPPRLDIVAAYTQNMEQLRQRLMVRKAELERQWIKDMRQWEVQVRNEQIQWLAGVNLELAPLQIAAYFVASNPPSLFWNVAFVPLVDYAALMYEHALSDRPFLRSPYENIRPSIKPPAAAREVRGTAPPERHDSNTHARADRRSKPVRKRRQSRDSDSSSSSSDELPESGVEQAPSTPQQVQLSVTVPAGCGPGSQLQVVTPQGKQVMCVVPLSVYPGMQFIVNVTE